MGHRQFGSVRDTSEACCFERTAVPPQRHLSDFPNATEAKVAFLKGALPVQQVPLTTRLFPPLCFLKDTLLAHEGDTARTRRSRAVAARAAPARALASRRRGCFSMRGGPGRQL